MLALKGQTSNARPFIVKYFLKVNAFLHKACKIKYISCLSNTVTITHTLHFGLKLFPHPFHCKMTTKRKLMATDTVSVVLLDGVLLTFVQGWIHLVTR